MCQRAGLRNLESFRGFSYGLSLHRIGVGRGAASRVGQRELGSALSIAQWVARHRVLIASIQHLVVRKEAAGRPQASPTWNRCERCWQNDTVKRVDLNIDARSTNTAPESLAPGTPSKDNHLSIICNGRQT